MHLKRNGKSQPPHHQAAACTGLRSERIDNRHTQPVLHHGTHRHGTERFQQHLALHACLGKHRINLHAVAIVARQTDERLPLKVLRTEHLLGGQRVLCRQHRHLIHGGQRTHARARRWLGHFAQAQVKALGRHPLLQQRAVLRGHTDRHLAVVALQALQGTGQQSVAQGGHAQHAQAGLVGLAQRHGVFHHTIQPGPAAFHLIPQPQGTGIGAQAALAALEQRIAQQMLQPRQLTADRGLRGKQQLRRARGTARQHQGTKHFNMAMANAFRIGREGGCRHAQSISKVNSALIKKHWTACKKIEKMAAVITLIGPQRLLDKR